MRVYGKKLTALLLALCMLLGLAACGSGGDDGDGASQLSGTVYVPEFVDFDAPVDYIQSGCSDGKNVYLVGTIESYTLRDADGEEIRTMTSEDVEEYYKNNAGSEDGSYIDYSYRYGIFRISLDGAEVEELENYEPTPIPEGEEGDASIYGIRTGADGTLWITEQIYTYYFDLPENFDPETDEKWNYYTEGTNAQIIRQLDSTGNELARIDTASLKEKLGFDAASYTMTDNAGNLYVSNGNDTISVLDKDMNNLFSVQGENLYNELVQLGDGTIGIIVSYSDPETGNWVSRLRTIDASAKEWGSEYDLPYSVYTIYAGNEQYLFYYSNGDSLYGYKAETGEGEKILSWSSSDINSNDLNFFTFLPDGRVVAMTTEWGVSGRTVELALLTEQPASVLADKTILTYACMYLGYDVRREIIAFNRSSSKYRIEIQDYSEFNTEEDYTAGLTKLNAEIIAGNVPDILGTSNLPITQYGAKGLLEDLWPFIENDPDLGREALMENVFKAAEQSGKLYQVFSSFNIRTVVGATSVVGDRMSWTLEDLQAALATMPEGCALFSDSDTKDGMLNRVLSLNMGDFVDWTTGECDFNSDAFKAMLEFCNSFPLEYNWEEHQDEEYEGEPSRIASGKQMLMELYLYSLDSIQMYEAIFGGELSYVGYPREDGSVGSCFSISSGMAMSTTCKDKEGAWSFMRKALLPRDEDDVWYSSGDFSTNKADFEKMVEENMKVEYELDENGNPVLDENGDPVEASKGGWGWDNIDITLYATTQEQYDQFMALYNAIDSIYSYDEEIYSIVSEEAAGYFNGDRGVDETAEMIQSRVKLYVNESR